MFGRSSGSEASVVTRRWWETSEELSARVRSRDKDGNGWAANCVLLLLMGGIII